MADCRAQASRRHHFWVSRRSVRAAVWCLLRIRIGDGLIIGFGELGRRRCFELRDGAVEPVEKELADDLVGNLLGKLAWRAAIAGPGCRIGAAAEQRPQCLAVAVSDRPLQRRPAVFLVMPFDTFWVPLHDQFRGDDVVALRWIAAALWAMLKEQGVKVGVRLET